MRMEASKKTPTKEELYSAFELLRKLTPEHELLQLAPVGPGAIYTTLVTLWMLTLQRLGGGSSLVEAVKVIQEHGRNLLPDNKRVREETLSRNSGAYSEARRRLPIKAAELFASSICRSLVDRTPSWFGDQRAYIIDGTTITLSPTSGLTQAFPPATNQHGVTVWPVLRMLVAHELQSGCALIPEIGAMYGAKNTSEAKQAVVIAKRLPRRSIAMADSGFGIFMVGYAMIGQGHDILFRLTKSRYKALRRQAERIETTETSTTHRLRWTPSGKDRLTNPDLPADAVLHVLLHQVELKSGDCLLLVTTLPHSSEQAAEAYSCRYDVEHDIRDFKVTMRLEKIRACSEAMVRKEILCSVVAYNLVLEFRREAAKIARLPPRRLSFTGVWNTFEIYLLHQPPCVASKWLERYEKALQIASKDKLSNRPNRSFPRKAHPRRPKSTKFMKSTTHEKTTKAEVSVKPPPK
jgi:DDE family transposase